MLASAVRELSASTNPTLVAAAFFEKTIQIWDLQSRARVSEFSAGFCSGARNLALAPSARVLVAGVSANPGRVAAYDVPSGRVLWRRKVIYPSLLRFHPSGETVLCSSNNASTLRFDVHSGNTVEVIEGLSQCIEGRYGDQLKVPAGGAPFRLQSKHREIDIARDGLALLDARFSPDAVCLTEALGSVRCVNCDDGSRRWRFDPGTDSHVLLLHYSPGTDAFFGVLRDLVDREGRYLVRFDSESGACERICKLGSWEQAFLDASDQLITSEGEIRDMSGGTLVSQLAFPTMEYPDE